MNTTMPNASTIERKWYILDAADKPLGHTAVIAADLLRGKYKPDFAPHADCGDHVVIINAAKAVLTGKKLEKKFYYHHTGYIGHMKAISYGHLMQKDPCFAMMKAIKGMIPDNTVGANSLKRVRIYAGAEHKQEAQAPQAFEL